MSLIKKISFVVDPHQSANRIFDYSPHNPVNRDDGVYPFFLLKQALQQRGIEISTHDVLPPSEADLVLFLDIPAQFSLYESLPNKYVILTESVLIKPQNWDLNLHQKFQKIFTWNDDFIDNKKYFKLNFSNKIYRTNCELSRREKFCCLIAGAKKNNHPYELYSKRVEAIRWFERSALQHFDLYGVGWDLYQFTGPIFIRALNRIRILRHLLAPKYPSYRGMVKSKKETLLKYQFSICYENAEKIPGYITEKIFDALFAGCIPVYWGAPNIKTFIPDSCFIDKRNFTSYETLYQYLKDMPLETIQEYQKNIYNYLGSEQVYPYTAEFFAKTLSEQII